MKYRISMTVHGALEGELQGTVEADNMEEAREKAYEAFKNSCREVEEVEVEDE
mgnify:CR=1 FL=1